MKKIIPVAIIMFIVIIITACGGSQEQKTATQPVSNNEQTAAPAAENNPDDQGIGKFRDVKIDPKLDASMAKKGQEIFDVKCGSCHKLTEERLVGPGWKDVTKRRRAEWIMNFVTNVDEMLNKDAKAQSMLEVCLVRMPNQNLTDEDARHIYEFMRKNDGVK